MNIIQRDSDMKFICQRFAIRIHARQNSHNFTQRKNSPFSPPSVRHFKSLSSIGNILLYRFK